MTCSIDFCSEAQSQSNSIHQHSPSHRFIFLLVSAFLREVISHSSKNGTDPVILATLFCTMFLRDPPNKRYGAGVSGHFNQQNHTKKKAAFLHHFLVNEPDDWDVDFSDRRKISHFLLFLTSSQDVIVMLSTWFVTNFLTGTNLSLEWHYVLKIIFQRNS